jgi:hypothetical protein
MFLSFRSFCCFLRLTLGSTGLRQMGITAHVLILPGAAVNQKRSYASYPQSRRRGLWYRGSDETVNSRPQHPRDSSLHSPQARHNAAVQRRPSEARPSAGTACWAPVRASSCQPTFTDKILSLHSSLLRDPFSNSNLVVCAKFRSLPSHGTPWRHSRILHRCDTRRHCRSGNRQRGRHPVF